MKQPTVLLLGFLVTALGIAGACSSKSPPKPTPTRGGSAGATGDSSVGSVVISGANPKPRSTTWSVNYWQWTPTYGDDVSGTEPQIAALAPAVLRVGGYNNDANTPDAFDNAQLDRAVAYARAVGAEPLLQVPLLADTAGNPPTADTAAAMVTYANVTQGYGVKYFSIGNEPDLYATQGSLLDASKPAIANYGPADYCASARAYVTAMKAVDPTIKIVGPDLSWKYIPSSDFLTPVLQGCGELFDIVSIHRYPFNSKQATLSSARTDAVAFGKVLGSVRALMQAAGHGDAPLALMEMNVVYDATACQLTASPATIGSALWLADGLGTAIEQGLWTSAIWDISDTDNESLGLIGPSPAHTARPEYYAYQLFADHFGPTLVDVTQTPASVRAYASRNQADDTTDVIVINWSTSSAPLEFRVTDVASVPASVTYTLPAVSISAITIPDQGAPTASAYDDAQQKAGQGPVALTPGASEATDAGLPEPDRACSSDASTICPKLTLPSASITTQGAGDAGNLSYGSAPYQWDIYTYAADGQPVPTAQVTPDGNGIQISGHFVAPVTDNWEGVGLSFNSASCIDASTYTGIEFDFSGDLGACTLALGANFSGNQYAAEDPGRGSCAGSDSVCYPPMSVVTPPAAGDDGSAGDTGSAGSTGSAETTTIRVPFSSFTGGSPNSTLDPSTIVTVQWQLNALSGGPGCSANFTVANVAFY